MSTAPRARALVFAALLVVYVGLAIHRDFIIDDAYISFRYARNLVDGHGLVFNLGQRVEGYSNFTWVLLAAAGMKAGVAPEAFSRWLGIVSGAATLAVVWALSLRLLPKDPRGRWLALLPVALLVANRSFVAWSTGGLETRFATVLLYLGILGLSMPPRRASWWTGLPLALLVLTRADGFVAAVTLVAGLFFFRKTYGAWYPLAVGAWVFGAWAAQTIFRVAYYGALLPNTFFVKVEGFPIRQGLTYLGAAALYYGIPLALLLGAATALRRNGTAPPIPALLLALITVHLAYLAAIGGDHFEFRFLDPVWPALAILAVAGAGALVPRPAAGAILVGLAVWNAVPAFVGFQDRWEIVSIETEARFCSLWAQVGPWFREHAGPGETIALRPVGVIPYLSGLRTLDMHGLTDPAVARQPADPAVDVPGHRKVATTEYLVLHGANYLLDHPNLHSSPPPLDPPRGLTIAGRRYAFIETRVPIGAMWLRFWIVSADAVVGDQVVPSRVRTRIKP